MPLAIVSTRNGTGSTSGYREDLVSGDLVALSLSSLVGVTNVRWELVGRPEGSAAGGAGPEPVLLSVATTASFTVDSDAGSFKTDGTYVVQATINPGSPGETRVRVILCRLAGIAIPGPGGGVRTLRKLGGFEQLEDTSVITILLGWATQLNRWLEAVRGLVAGGGGGGGTGGESFSANDSPDDASGNEVVIWQFTFDGAVRPAGILTANFAFQAKSPSGATTFKLYVGGNFVDRWTAPGGGTAVGSPAVTSSATYAKTGFTASFTNPGTAVPIQITMKSPVGQTAYARECNGTITP